VTGKISIKTLNGMWGKSKGWWNIIVERRRREEKR